MQKTILLLHTDLNWVAILKRLQHRYIIKVTGKQNFGTERVLQTEMFLVPKIN